MTSAFNDNSLLSNQDINQFLTVAVAGLFLRNVNNKHKLYKIKKNKNKKTKIHKVLQLLSMIFHILKSLHDIFIINPTSYISFTVHIQAIIH